MSKYNKKEPSKQKRNRVVILVDDAQKAKIEAAYKATDSDDAQGTWMRKMLLEMANNIVAQSGKSG